MSDWDDPGTEILKLLKLEKEAELTNEVSTELTFDSKGEPGVNFGCAHPP